jgi:5-(carboxyamino)imidazole ribonucleotide mutase
VPVGTMAIGKPGAVNAALYAAALLSLKYPELRPRLAAWRQARTHEVLQDRELS